MSKNIKINKVFHPGYYLREYLEELQMTQDEFAKRLGVSGKQISLILAENASITVDIAYKLSRLMGNSIELWLNLQSKYDAYMVEIAAQKILEEEKKIYKMIDKDFLIQVGIISKEDKLEKCIENLRTASFVSSLTSHTKKDIYSFYRTSIVKEETLQNIVCRNIWVSIASEIAKKQNIDKFNERLLIENINNFRKMTMMKPEDFYPRMKKILSDCGVSLVILPSLKKSNINGVVKWLDSDKVMMALNTRGAYNDKFWFSFFHELKHVLQKTKRKIIIGEDYHHNLDIIYEYDADLFAKETLIPTNEINQLSSYDTDSIINFSKKINIHPGIVVGRLQKEGKLSYAYLNELKVKYDINTFN